jgi:hypothetical protein
MTVGLVVSATFGYISRVTNRDLLNSTMKSINIHKKYKIILDNLD